jgi:hypothetical protein
MAKAIRSGGFEPNFPHRLTWVLKLVRILPFRLRYPLIHWVARWEKRPLAPARRRKA